MIGGWGWDNGVGNPPNAGNLRKPWRPHLYIYIGFEKQSQESKLYEVKRHISTTLSRRNLYLFT